MINLKQFEIWFITGSQHLYGEETLQQVDAHSQAIAEFLDRAADMPVRIVFKPVVKTTDEIYAICQAANAAPACIGVITWMHTFSPAKMWIRGLTILNKPLLHLHTQFNRDIPWGDIDMDFMNLNQSAHGDREFGFMMTRMHQARPTLNRKVVVGFWQEASVVAQLADWARVAVAAHELKTLKVVRFGDNMRQVAVTDGDKVAAEMTFGMSVNTHGIGDLVTVINQVSDADVDRLVTEYADTYTLMDSLQRGGAQHSSLRDAARIEIGMRAFLQDGGFGAYSDTFEDLYGMKQLPGIASQRLMADGYGFAGEGDWKTAAMVRVMKVMAAGLPGGNSFMEDYTYHFDPTNPLVLGSHMLEICPSIADGKPSCEVHPLGIGGKEDPVRLVFNAPAGPAINVSLVDMGNRFRFIVNEVEAVAVTEALPKLPVARALWKPMPDMATGCAAWILAGGAHHTVFSQNLTTSHIEDFADIFGVELVVIDSQTKLRQLKNELRWSEAAYRR
ncbi:L-arabinose isomerase [Spirosoma sordidisoli]|uniref:L-arabinose isomerase n=1 Tax=Spirosoma sordidisoli TaxID=2502893 RepID=A0A4Q2UN72_9BACT|nr:L-arabinose isomerase [Spirosoma sordidisoli]RYC68995.1 L-arabinose isomerase [Spirosoma sordidisoli]